nr:ADOP family duplicated permease [Lysobacter sp. CAU 1642]
MFEDIRFALRSLRRAPGSTLAIVLILGLGIGLNTAVFSLYDGIVVRALDYTHSERLVFLQQYAEDDAGQAFGFSPIERADYADLPGLDALEEFHTMSFTVLGLDEPVRVQTGVVSASFFQTLGVQAQHGRLFREGEDAYEAAPTVLLSHEFWRRQLGADPAAVGRTLTMNDRAHEVIGVLPPMVQLPNANDLYITLAHCPTRSNPDNYGRRDFRLLQLVGRTAVGVDAETVATQLATRAAALRTSHPGDYPGERPPRVEAQPLKQVFAARFTDTGQLLLGIAALVLAAALANVANLTLSRLARRSAELGVRGALGASRLRLARMLLVEHLLLGLAGGLAGCLLASLAVGWMRDHALDFTPLAADVGLDWRVLGFALGLSLVVGCLVGLLPALGSGRLKRPLLAGSSARGSSEALPARRLRAGLIVAQLAISLVVATAASLMLRSLAALHAESPGFRIDQVVSARVEMNTASYRELPRRIAFVDGLRQRLAAAPGIQAVSVSLALPMQASGAFMETAVSLPGRGDLDPAQLPAADFRIVGEGYFDTLAIPLRSGRAFTAADDLAGRPVALVNESMARAYWGDRDPTGHSLLPAMNMSGFTELAGFEVLGVVGDVRQYGLRDSEGPAFYVPYRQAPMRQVRVTVRGPGGEAALKRSLHEAVRAEDPNLPVDQLLTLGEVRDADLAPTRLVGWLLGWFAALVIGVSAVGLAGLVSFDVEQRLREFAIRMALGAGVPGLRRRLLGQALRLVALGVGIGAVGAWLVGLRLESRLFGVGSADPPSFLAAAGVLLASAVIASLLPTRRLRALSPSSVLNDA